MTERKAVFMSGKPVNVAFYGYSMERTYIFERLTDYGIVVSDPETKQVLFIPWASFFYLSWDKKSDKK